MQLRGDTLVAVSPEHVSTTVGGETVILELDKGEYFSLAGVGEHVWRMLDHPRRVDEFVASVVASFDVDEETCRADVIAFVRQLLEAGLVDIAE